MDEHVSPESVPLPPSEPRHSEDAPLSSAASENNDTAELSNQDPASLAQQLQTVTAEKHELEKQHTALLAKLKHMREAIAERLREDAAERDEQLTQITSLKTDKESLNATVERLKNELVQSHTDLEAAYSERDRIQSRSLDSQTLVTDLETEVQNLNEEIERVKSEREDWQETAGRERVSRENMSNAVHSLEIQRDTLKGEKEAVQIKYEKEAQSNINLQQILAEMQASKDKEIEEKVFELESQLTEARASLSEFKQRATLAESQLAAQQKDSQRTLALQKEVKEKTLLAGKLRHEAVILNEHLNEALRRLKNDSTENNVDKRLVSNVLIAFVTTPRADAKRFEMLKLLSNILSWTDDEREKVGLQRPVDSIPRKSMSSSPSHHSAKSTGNTEFESENFSDLWIEFLLREASQAKPRQPSSSSHNPSSSSSPPPPTPKLSASQLSSLSSSSSPQKQRSRSTSMRRRQSVSLSPTSNTVPNGGGANGLVSTSIPSPSSSPENKTSIKTTQSSSSK